MALLVVLAGPLCGPPAGSAWAQATGGSSSSSSSTSGPSDASSTSTTSTTQPSSALTGPPAPTATGPPISSAPTTPPTTTISSQQNQVVTAAHIGPLNAARLAVDRYSAATSRDQQALAADQNAATAAAAALAAATGRLDADRSALAADRTDLTADRRMLALDRARLGALAIGMYTGALTNPQPASPEDLQAASEQIIDSEEADIVAGQVDSHLHRDLATVTSDVGRVGRAATGVQADQRAATEAARTVTDVADRTRADRAALVADRSRLTLADYGLDVAEAALTAALDAVHGPGDAPSGQLTLLGGAALTAPQLVAWFNSQGYVDLTSASIQELATWYIQAGAEEGVRGDVAFAQAVLETGGFSSPDAVDLSNFAGIGHCDTCAAGWAFPSPKLGVLGHVQLLRIFADKGPGPAHAPPPVLPVLVPAQQGEAGCCSTVQSLTGVWATDPTYGQQILEIYASMLASALSPA